MNGYIYDEQGDAPNNGKLITYLKDKGCMICISHANCTASGQPMIRRGGKRSSVARYVYEREVGPIPDGMFMHMKCGDKKCINSDHMEIRPLRDTRKLRHEDREAAAHLADKFTYATVCDIYDISERTLVRIRHEFGLISDEIHDKRDPDTGQFIK